MPKKALAGPATVYIAAQFRSEKGASLRALEASTSLSRETINRALKGESAIAIDTYLALCAALNIDAADLLRRANAVRAKAPTPSEPLRPPDTVRRNQIREVGRKPAPSPHQ